MRRVFLLGFLTLSAFAGELDPSCKDALTSKSRGGFDWASAWRGMTGSSRDQLLRVLDSPLGNSMDAGDLPTVQAFSAMDPKVTQIQRVFRAHKIAELQVHRLSLVLGELQASLAKDQQERKNSLFALSAAVQTEVDRLRDSLKNLFGIRTGRGTVWLLPNIDVMTVYDRVAQTDADLLVEESLLRLCDTLRQADVVLNIDRAVPRAPSDMSVEELELRQFLARFEAAQVAKRIDRLMEEETDAEVDVYYQWTEGEHHSVLVTDHRRRRLRYEEVIFGRLTQEVPRGVFVRFGEEQQSVLAASASLRKHEGQLWNALDQLEVRFESLLRSHQTENVTEQRRRRVRAIGDMLSDMAPAYSSLRLYQRSKPQDPTARWEADRDEHFRSRTLALSEALQLINLRLHLYLEQVNRGVATTEPVYTLEDYARDVHERRADLVRARFLMTGLGAVAVLATGAALWAWLMF